MYNNPYFNQQQRYQPNNNQMVQQPYMQQYQPIQPITPINNQIGLLGKTVESVDVVKAIDINFDGSINYFPLIDGSAIITKQIQPDGTSKIIIFKPTDSEQKDFPQYVTIEELKKELNNFDIVDVDEIKEDIQELKKEIKLIKKKRNDE